MLSSKYDIKSTKRIRNHIKSFVVENNNAKIYTEIEIPTDEYIIHRKPDIIVFDKKQNTIQIIEVGITSQEKLVTVKVKKSRKYNPLAKELGRRFGNKVIVIPFVITWDGVVTKINKKYRNIIGIDKKVLAHIQKVTIKRTLESIIYVSFTYKVNPEYLMEEEIIKKTQEEMKENRINCESEEDLDF